MSDENVEGTEGQERQEVTEQSETTETVATTQTQPWYYGADEESIKTASRYTSGAEAAKALREHQATATKALQELDDLRKAVPGEVADYGINTADLREGLGEDIVPDPEVFDTEVNKLLGVLKEVGVPKDRAGKIFDWWKEQIDSTHEATLAGLEAERKNAEAELKKEWGAEYDRNNKAMTAFMRKYGRADVNDFLNTTKVDGVALGNHPMMRRWVAQAGRDMLEGSTYTGSTDAGFEELERSYKETHAEYAKAVNSHDYHTADKLFEQKSKLRDELEKAKQLRQAA